MTLIRYKYYSVTTSRSFETIINISQCVLIFSIIREAGFRPKGVAGKFPAKSIRKTFENLDPLFCLSNKHN